MAATDFSAKSGEVQSNARELGYAKSVASLQQDRDRTVALHKTLWHK
jgi:hypothetical protein